MKRDFKCLMFQGTGSDVGKTVLVAGLCRVARRRGINVMPFKPQNMSNNAAVASPDRFGDSGEMGRAQWLQALACGVTPSVHMNPILLKPQSETGSQVVVQGKVRATAKARDYFALKPKLLHAVLDSFNKIGEQADLVIVEGAGSPAEINLRHGDIANMGFAEAADVPVVLVGDIDRGGVIASIVGTHTILPSPDRNRIAGYLINKFRGDVSLFDAGLAAISEFSGWKSFGILPWLEAVGRLPSEDSVALERLYHQQNTGITVAVPVLGKIANFDDLDPLRAERNVNLVFVKSGQALPPETKLVVLAGSKSTIADLEQFRENGWDNQLRELVQSGSRVIGLCGGYQMLGKTVSDPSGIEGPPSTTNALGYLDVETELVPEKTTVNQSAVSSEFNVLLEGYEIHVGRTNGEGCARPMIRFSDKPDGAMSEDGQIQGCYLHGLFHNDAYRASLLSELGTTSEVVDFRAEVDATLDELADQMEAHLDISGLLALAT